MYAGPDAPSDPFDVTALRMRLDASQSSRDCFEAARAAVSASIAETVSCLATWLSGTASSSVINRETVENLPVASR